MRKIHLTGGKFTEQILADLIGQGYSGNELLQNPNMSPMRMSLAGRRKSGGTDESD